MPRWNLIATFRVLKCGDYCSNCWTKLFADAMCGSVLHPFSFGSVIGVMIQVFKKHWLTPLKQFLVTIIIFLIGSHPEREGEHGDDHRVQVRAPDWPLSRATCPQHRQNQGHGHHEGQARRGRAVIIRVVNLVPFVSGTFSRIRNYLFRMRIQHE